MSRELKATISASESESCLQSKDLSYFDNILKIHTGTMIANVGTSRKVNTKN